MKGFLLLGLEMCKVKFSKPSTTASQQIEILRNRGMVISDESFAKKCLHNIGYYRLSGYWFKFQRKWNNVSEDLTLEASDRFVSAISFEEIVEIYRFDTKIRSLFFDALEKIEISITSHLCDYMDNNTENTWYTKQKYFDCDSDTFFKLKEDIDSLINKNRDKPALTSFFSKYDEEYPPFWIISPYLTFGIVSRLYANLKLEYKKRIADKYGMNEYFMVSSLRNLANIRNLCAHYCRLWDNPIRVKSINVKFATKLSKFNQKFLKNSDGNYLLFSAFYIISLYLCIITPDSKFCSLFKELIDKYQKKNPLITYDKMGFPDNWSELPLFSKMLKNRTELQKVRELLAQCNVD